MWETWVRSLGWEDPLEKEMATHSSILAWKIPWTEEPGGLQSTGLQRVRHDWATSLSLWLTERQARDLTVWLVVKKPGLSGLGPVVCPLRLLRGAHLNIACCQRRLGRASVYMFNLTLVRGVSREVSSFFPSPDFHLLPWVVMLPVLAAATVVGTGELPGALDATDSQVLLLSAVFVFFTGVNACSDLCPSLPAF